VPVCWPAVTPPPSSIGLAPCPEYCPTKIDSILRLEWLTRLRKERRSQLDYGRSSLMLAGAHPLARCHHGPRRIYSCMILYEHTHLCSEPRIGEGGAFTCSCICIFRIEGVELFIRTTNKGHSSSPSLVPSTYDVKFQAYNPVRRQRAPSSFPWPSVILSNTCARRGKHVYK
jgi:hypothetical protein